MGGLSMVDYLGLNVRHVDSTDVGGSSYLLHVSHAAQAIAMGKCDVALVTLAPLASPPPQACLSACSLIGGSARSLQKPRAACCPLPPLCALAGAARATAAARALFGCERRPELVQQLLVGQDAGHLLRD